MATKQLDSTNWMSRCPKCRCHPDQLPCQRHCQPYLRQDPKKSQRHSLDLQRMADPQPSRSLRRRDRWKKRGGWISWICGIAGFIARISRYKPEVYSKVKLKCISAKNKLSTYTLPASSSTQPERGFTALLLQSPLRQPTSIPPPWILVSAESVDGYLRGYPPPNPAAMPSALPTEPSAGRPLCENPRPAGGRMPRLRRRSPRIALDPG